MKSLIFIHGVTFGDARSGLGRRTQLMFKILGERPEFTERILASPREAEAFERTIQERGWGRFFTERYQDWRNAGGLKRLLFYVWRIVAGIGMRFHRSLKDLALSSIGGADLHPSRALQALLNSKPGATVWLARCDLLHLTPFLRADHVVVLDSNDSVANLLRCYDSNPTFRRLGGYSREQAVRMIAETEQRLAARCDLILAISRDDQAFYSQSRRPRVVLEESCIAATEGEAQTIAYDIGFLGGSYGGAVAAANHLVQLAGDPALSKYRFAIAGEVCRLLPAHALANLSVVGRVADSTQFLRSCKQVVLWSDLETGTSVKFQEAVLSGTTVLSNENASRWSLAVPGRDYLLCETLDEVRAHILQGSTVEPDEIQSHATEETISERVAAALWPGRATASSQLKPEMQAS